MPVQVSAGGVPIRAIARCEPQPHAKRSRIRIDRHRRLPGRPLFRHFRRVRQGGRERYFDPAHAGQSRSGPRAAARIAYGLVPQYLVVDAGSLAPGALESRGSGHRHPRGIAAELPADLGGAASAVIHRKRFEHAGAMELGQRPEVRERRFSPPHHSRARRRGESGRARHQGVPVVPFRSRARPDPDDSPAPDRAHRAIAPDSRRRQRLCGVHGGGGGILFIRAGGPLRGRETRAEAGVRRAALVEAVLSFRGGAVVEG